MRLKPEQRLMLGKLARQDISKNVLMISFSVSRTTVWYWGKQNLHSVSDIPHNYKGKITIEAEITILFFKNAALLSLNTCHIRNAGCGLISEIIPA